MIQSFKDFFWRFGKKLSLRVWSNLIFLFAFVIPALFFFGLGLVSTVQKYHSLSLIKASQEIRRVEESFLANLSNLETLARSFLDDKNLRLLFGALNNVDRYEEENPMLQQWLSEELEQLQETNHLAGMAIVSLNKKVLAHTHAENDFPEPILKSPLAEAPQFRNSISGVQLIPVTILDVNEKKEISIDYDLDYIPIVAAKVPIIEEDKISGTLLIYQLLHDQHNWFRRNADISQCDVGLYIDNVLLRSQPLDSATGNSGKLVRFLRIWNHSTSFQKTFDPKQFDRNPDLNFFHIKDFEKKKVGAIAIRINTDQYADDILATVLLISFLASVWIILGVIFRIWTLRIINRIHHVVDSIQEISTGKYNSRLRTDGHREISELSHEINKMAMEIEKREQLKDDFMANTSHELRTPLLGIIGLAESLIDGSTGPLSPQTKNQLSMISASGNRLSKLINDILDTAKLKNEDLVLTTKPIDLKPLVDVVFNLLHPLLKGKNVKLNNHISPRIPLIEGDEERVFQIFFNLIGNAIKFTENGIVSISAEVKEKWVKVFVEDSGIGISSVDLDSIFRSFKQVDSTSEKHYGGTGLGLSITRYLVELHGGQIGVTSQPQEGTVFHFTLPVSMHKTANSSTNPSIVSSNRIINTPDFEPGKKHKSLDENGDVTNQRTYHILVVDDDPVNLQVISGYLSSTQYSVTTMTSGQEALEHIARHKPNLILLDIMMPIVSGFEVCRQIRKRYSIDELPVIFLTAKNQVSDLLEGFSSGANDYITKPFLKNELLVRIERHLEANRSIERLTSLNRFSDQLKKVSSTKQMMELAFLMICQNLEIESGVLLFKGKVNQSHNTNETNWSEQLSPVKQQNEEILIIEKPMADSILIATINGFEDYQFVLRRAENSPAFSALEREYLRSLMDRIRGSQYHFAELLKDPNYLVSLFKIQSDLEAILYIKAKSPYCYVYFEKQAQPSIYRISIKLLQRYFHEDLLLKVQRSYMVNPNKVKAIIRSGKDDIVMTMANNDDLPVSRNLITKIIEKFPGFLK